MPFVVRYPIGLRLYQNTPGGMPIHVRDEACFFDTLDEAKASVKAANLGTPKLEIFEVSWGIVWKAIDRFGNDRSGLRYYVEKGTWSGDKREGVRFNTKAGAYATIDAKGKQARYPSRKDGGWRYGFKVVRFLRKVA